MELAQKLELLREMLGCVGDISLWHLDARMELISTNNWDPELFSVTFDGRSRETVQAFFEKEGTPVIVSNGISISWLASPHFVQGTLVDTYLIGPVFTSAVSESYIQQRIRELHVSRQWEDLALRYIHKVPIVAYPTLIQYGMMLYYCITGQKIQPEAIRFIDPPSAKGKKRNGRHHSGDLEYAFQLEIIQAVEDGNVDFVHPKRVYSATVGTVSREGPLRQAKNIMISFITLVSRAAIRGGMSAADAFDLADFYILISEDCTNEAEVYQNGQTCLRDYTQRVHRIRQAGYSKVTQDCLDYIARNVREKITMDELSEALKYSKNYLSTKIHEETGMTIRQIITQQKLKQAALWLTSTTKPIQDICHELSFESPSYFSSQFRKAYGMTPKEYRERK